MQLDSKERLATGWAGIGNAGSVPQRVNAPDESKIATAHDDSMNSAHVKRSWTRGIFAFARNAAIGLLMFTFVPVAVVGWRQTHPPKYNPAVMQERLVLVDRLRPLAAPKNPSITPMQAGLALRALQSSSGNEHSSANAVALKSARPWRNYILTPDMFPSMQTPAFNGPMPKIAVEYAARGYSPAEMTYLRAIAESPLWKDFDIVGKAEGVDLIAGISTQSSTKSAAVFELPMMRFSDTKDIANAGVMRAAYYLATGDQVRAEVALHSIVSFGFAIIDNGTTAFDGMLGRSIVDIGRDGLEQFSRVINRSYPANEDPSYQPFKQSKQATQELQKQALAPISAEAYRKRLIADAANTSLPRSLRFERLRQLSMSTCTNVSELVLGPNTEVRDAFDNASRTLARYPSEKAFLELMYASTSRMPQSELPEWAVAQFFDGAVTIAATVTQNPRLAACSRVALGIY